MAVTTTPVLGLRKPDYDELADIDLINDNMDIIDAAIGSDRSQTVPVNKGGTGQTAVTQAGGTSAAQIAEVATAATNITITSAYFTQWGRVAQVNVTFKSTQDIAANARVSAFTVAAGKRPKAVAGGCTSFMAAEVATTGACSVRNIQGSNLAAGTERQVSFTYILP